MEGEKPQKEAAPAPPQAVYTHEELINFENSQAFSSLGKTVLSTKPSAPRYGFGTGTRAHLLKVYQDKDLEKTQFQGKTGPGPIYSVTDKYQYSADPKWGFGSGKRPPLSVGKKYIHNDIIDVATDVLRAEAFRKTENPRVKFGRANRFESQSLINANTDNFNCEIKSLGSKYHQEPKYTFGFRRTYKNQSALTRPSSNPPCVAPTTYDPNWQVCSNHPATVKHSFPQKQKFDPLRQDLTNQTFEVYHSVGKQQRSYKRNMPAIKVGTENREKPKNHFKADMINRPTPLRLPHAHY